MCRLLLSTSAYESEDLYLNTLILNQRLKPFTENDIISIVESEGIDPKYVKKKLQSLIQQGLVIRAGSKFYVRPISRNRTYKLTQNFKKTF